MAAEDNNNIMNINDPLDINELAALNDDISAEFIEQLQNQITQNSNLISDKPAKQDVTTLFEEVEQKPQQPTVEKTESVATQIDENIDDNFIKKYKAKIEKQENTIIEESLEQSKIQEKLNTKQENTQPEVDKMEIETLSNGNIIERPINQNQLDYNESLDLLDNNIKYSKYVIYIDPENQEFIESLTVKERKNLINRILKEQDNIVITEKRFHTIQTYLKHAIVAIITIAIATPIIYFTINASLEATINNHRRSQSIFKTLYKEKGKIKNIKY